MTRAPSENPTRVTDLRGIFVAEDYWYLCILSGEGIVIAVPSWQAPTSPFTETGAPRSTTLSTSPSDSFHQA